MGPDENKTSLVQQSLSPERSLSPLHPVATVSQDHRLHAKEGSQRPGRGRARELWVLVLTLEKGEGISELVRETSLLLLHHHDHLLVRGLMQQNMREGRLKADDPAAGPMAPLHVHQEDIPSRWTQVDLCSHHENMSHGC